MAPPLKRILPEVFFTSTDIKPEKLSGVQTGNRTPHDRYNIRGIAHACTSRKDNIFMKRRLVQSFTYLLEWGQQTCTLRKHTRRWTYSTLRHFFLSISGIILNTEPFLAADIFMMQYRGVHNKAVSDYRFMGNKYCNVNGKEE